MPKAGRRYAWCFAGAGVLLAALVAIDLCTGHLGASEALRSGIMLKLRLPRVLTAMLSGAALSLCGVQMQAVFRNPLADPHIMGVSSGAGLGAAVAVVLAGGSYAYTVALSSLAGAAFASLLIIAAAAKIRGASSLLIFGVMLGFIFSAVTAIIAYSADEESLKVFYSWNAGSFAGNRPQDLAFLAAVLALCTAGAAANTRGLDLILFSDEYSFMNGRPPKATRAAAMVSCCMATSAATALCGPLGFVGIAAPHISRAVSGTSKHSVIVPLSLPAGAAVAVAADIISQAAPVPLPAGSTLALIGIPVILYIMARIKKEDLWY